MKFKLFFTIGIFLSSICYLNAQDNKCKVLKEVINKEYKGDCKKGLAHGFGIAKGKYLYEGNFKKGLPNGKGVLKYSLTEYYEGQWKNGLENGKGELHYKVNGADSIKVGIWENGNYIGRKKISPYKIVFNRGVDRYSINFIGEGNGSNTNRVLIKFLQNGADNSQISNIRIQADSGNRTSFNNAEGYENITFPFNCKLSYDTPNKLQSSTHTVTFEFIINKEGDWEVELNN